MRDGQKDWGGRNGRISRRVTPRLVRGGGKVVCASSKGA